MEYFIVVRKNPEKKIVKILVPRKITQNVYVAQNSVRK